MKAMKKAYSTTSTAALQILNGVIPLDIEAHEKHIYWTTNNILIYNNRIRTQERPHPARRQITYNTTKEENRIIIHVDTSVDKEGRVGIGIVINKGNGNIQKTRKRADNGTEVHIAELLAIREGITEGTTRGLKTIEIYTDRQGATEAVGNPNSQNKLAVKIQKLIEERNNRDMKTIVKWEKSKNNIASKLAHEEANNRDN